MAKGEYTAETNPAVSEKRKLYYAANREHILARSRTARLTPEGKERMRETNRQQRAKRSPEQREAIRAYMREYTQARKEQTAQKRRENAPHHRLLKKKSRLKRLGLTIEHADAIFAAQGYGCAICGEKETRTGRDWHFDHDHTTGNFRGILCHGCNTGLGGFRDEIAALENAIKYLKISVAGR